MSEVAYDGIRRVPPGYLLTTFEYDMDDPIVWPAHRHDEHELLWSVGGMARLEADGRVWAIPPALAVWVPSRVAHQASAERGARVRATYFTEGGPHDGAMPSVVTGVAMTEPLRALLDHNLMGTVDTDARMRVQRVILDLLVPAPRESFELVMPRSPHLHMVASAILADPGDKRTTADWGYECGMHGRTLARQFEVETGMTFTQWRILARLQLAIRELTHGRSIVSVSRQVGYRNPSTFIDHFRELTGQTPAEYVRGARSPRPSTG
ncbi:helix-turn-helix domain-containing protein [Microbacterium sp. NPDC089696]|uniref:helix-turn-helix domain-containing protein n=1 Tax=Microbacterium sp. NPDC089696 TaxID=3364199 RepID=UPI003820DE38